MGGFMATTWLATKGDLTRHTANRYRWMIDHNITPRIGSIRLDALRAADLDACYANLITNGGRRQQGLSPKTMLEIHRVISNALDLAVDRQLIDTNPARRARPPRRTSRSTVPAIWDEQQPTVKSPDSTGATCSLPPRACRSHGPGKPRWAAPSKAR
jgi:hypothetical protein